MSNNVENKDSCSICFEETNVKIIKPYSCRCKFPLCDLCLLEINKCVYCRKLMTLYWYSYSNTYFYAYLMYFYTFILDMEDIVFPNGAEYTRNKPLLRGLLLTWRLFLMFWVLIITIIRSFTRI